LFDQIVQCPRMNPHLWLYKPARKTGDIAAILKLSPKNFNDDSHLKEILHS
jgi:hypothetical protein